METALAAVNSGELLAEGASIGGGVTAQECYDRTFLDATIQEAEQPVASEACTSREIHDYGESLKKAVEAVLSDKSFELSPLGRICREIAKQFLQWISLHKNEACSAEREIEKMLLPCFKHKRKRQACYREVMWSKYHTIRTSREYLSLWEKLLKTASCSAEPSPHFFQHVGHSIFKDLIQRHHFCISQTDSISEPPPMTYEEVNTLRYVAGYIPRLLKKRMERSSHKLRDDIQLCIFDLLDDGDDSDSSSKDWLKTINRGGLTLVNNSTFDVFVAIEEELRRLIHRANGTPSFDEAMKSTIIDCSNVQFFWSMIDMEWDDETSAALLEMLVSQYVKIRGFSLCSAWMEKFKQLTKKTTQKTKGIRKELIPQPGESAVKDSDNKVQESNNDTVVSDNENEDRMDIDNEADEVNSGDIDGQ